MWNHKTYFQTIRSKCGKKKKLTMRVTSFLEIVFPNKSLQLVLETNLKLQVRYIYCILSRWGNTLFAKKTHIQDFNHLDDTFFDDKAMQNS